MTHRLRRHLILIVLGLAFAVWTPASLLAKEHACATDAARFCADKKLGHGKTKCLLEHENELSDACKSRISLGREHIKEARSACKKDLDLFCKGVQAGEGRIIRCLKEHEAQVSAPCKASLPFKNK